MDEADCLHEASCTVRHGAKAAIHDRNQSFVMFRLAWVAAFAGMTVLAR
jgi:hypothetical protein